MREFTWRCTAVLKKTGSAGSLQLKIETAPQQRLIIDFFQYKPDTSNEDDGGTSVSNIKGYVVSGVVSNSTFYLMKDRDDNLSFFYPNPADIYFFDCMPIDKFVMFGEDYILFQRSYKSVNASDIIYLRGRSNLIAKPVLTLTGGTITTELNNVLGVIE